MAKGHKLRNLRGILFQSEAELRLAVEEIQGESVDDAKWAIAKPWYAPPYGEMSLEETLYGFGYAIQRRGKKRAIVKAGDRESLDSLLNMFSGIPHPAYFEEHIRRNESVRAIFGLSEPIPLEKLKATLVELGARGSYEGGGGIPLPYPKKISKSENNVDIWEVDYIYISVNPLDKLFPLPSLVLITSVKLGWHPAIVLAFFMCDIAPRNPLPLPTLIKDGQRLNIEVPRPGVSPQVVSQAYTRMRNAIMRETRGVNGKWTRPRGLPPRTIELALLVRSTLDLSWGQRLDRWNSEHPEQPYKNENVMAATYSRARSRIYPRTKRKSKIG